MEGRGVTESGREAWCRRAVVVARPLGALGSHDDQLPGDRVLSELGPGATLGASCPTEQGCGLTTSDLARGSLHFRSPTCEVRCPWTRATSDRAG
jgi:hypothetical protein